MVETRNQTRLREQQSKQIEKLQPIENRVQSMINLNKQMEDTQRFANPESPCPTIFSHGSSDVHSQRSSSSMSTDLNSLTMTETRDQSMIEFNKHLEDLRIAQAKHGETTDSLRAVINDGFSDLKNMIAALITPTPSLMPTKPPDPPDCKPGIEFPRFDGTKLLDWISHSENFFHLLKTPPEMKVRVASRHMVGKALQWHTNYMRERYGMFPSWTDYAIAIFTKFGDNDDLLRRSRAPFNPYRESNVNPHYQSSNAIFLSPTTKPPISKPNLTSKLHEGMQEKSSKFYERTYTITTDEHMKLAYDKEEQRLSDVQDEVQKQDKESKLEKEEPKVLIPEIIQGKDKWDQSGHEQASLTIPKIEQADAKKEIIMETDSIQNYEPLESSNSVCKPDCVFLQELPSPFQFQVSVSLLEPSHRFCNESLDVFDGLPCESVMNNQILVQSGYGIESFFVPRISLRDGSNEKQLTGLCMADGMFMSEKRFSDFSLCNRVWKPGEISAKEIYGYWLEEFYINKRALKLSQRDPRISFEGLAKQFVQVVETTVHIEGLQSYLLKCTNIGKGNQEYEMHELAVSVLEFDFSLPKDLLSQSKVHIPLLEFNLRCCNEFVTEELYSGENSETMLRDDKVMLVYVQEMVVLPKRLTSKCSKSWNSMVKTSLEKYYKSNRLLSLLQKLHEMSLILDMKWHLQELSHAYEDCNHMLKLYFSLGVDRGKLLDWLDFYFLEKESQKKIKTGVETIVSVLVTNYAIQLQQTGFYVWHRWKNKVDIFYVVLELLVLSWVNFMNKLYLLGVEAGQAHMLLLLNDLWERQPEFRREKMRSKIGATTKVKQILDNYQSDSLCVFLKRVEVINYIMTEEAFTEAKGSNFTMGYFESPLDLIITFDIFHSPRPPELSLYEEEESLQVLGSYANNH